MAFEIGERVKNSFSGPGTIAGPLHRECHCTDRVNCDKDHDAYQLVNYDSIHSGTRLTLIAKLSPYEDPKPKAPRKPRVKAAPADPARPGMCTNQANGVFCNRPALPDDSRCEHHSHKALGYRALSVGVGLFAEEFPSHPETERLIAQRVTSGGSRFFPGPLAKFSQEVQNYVWAHAAAWHREQGFGDLGSVIRATA